MKYKTLLPVIFLISFSAFSEETNVVFREPFTLRLPVDKEFFFEQECPPTPYVVDNTVYIFPDERVRVAITFSNDTVNLSYDQNNTSKQFFEFKFWSEPAIDENKIHSFLTGHNISPKRLVYDAAMVVHDFPRPLKTTILPTDAWIKNYEQWPYPIVQLMLYNFRLVDETEAAELEPVEQDLPSKLYAVLFRINVDAEGALTVFEMDRAIDPTSDSITPVDVMIPESYLKAAKEHALSLGYKMHLENDVPVDFYDFYFYNAKFPETVIREIE